MQGGAGGGLFSGAEGGGRGGGRTVDQVTAVELCSEVNEENDNAAVVLPVRAQDRRPEAKLCTVEEESVEFGQPVLW